MLQVANRMKDLNYEGLSISHIAICVNVQKKGSTESYPDRYYPRPNEALSLLKKIEKRKYTKGCTVTIFVNNPDQYGAYEDQTFYYGKFENKLESIF